MTNSNKNIYDHLWKEGWEAGSDWMPVKITQYRLSLKLIRRFPLKGDVMDVGGGNTSFWEIAKDMRKSLNSLTICDISRYALERAQQKNIKIVLMDITSLQPGFIEKYDSVCCFEVLEHIRDDEKALKNCFDMLKARGYIYISVPASKSFWSKSDEMSHHIRRYETDEMVLMLKKSGFDIKYFFNWGSFLFRMYQRLKGDIGPSFGKVKKKNKFIRLISLLLYHFFKFEDWLTSKKGIFLYIVAQKPITKKYDN